MQFGALPLQRKKHGAWLETALQETSPALAGIAVLKRGGEGAGTEVAHSSCSGREAPGKVSFWYSTGLVSKSL